MEKTKGFIAEFKSFLSRGNVVDMAVGVIIGTAFTAIVNSLVKEIIMPSVGYIIGGVKFESLKIVLTPVVGETPEVAILYGSFINQIINFVIIGLVVFIIVKLITKMRRKQEEAPVAESAPSDEAVLLSEIRDLLKKD